MQLYSFASSNITNIWAGIGAQRWAVSAAAGANAAVRSRARDLPVGAFGLLYCSESHSFTTPFVVYSKPNFEIEVTNIWPEKWILPFAIQPLGTPRKMLHKDKAKSLLAICEGATNISHVFSIPPITAFSSKELSDADWEIIMEQLADL